MIESVDHNQYVQRRHQSIFIHVVAGSIQRAIRRIQLVDDHQYVQRRDIPIGIGIRVDLDEIRVSERTRIDDKWLDGTHGEVRDKIGVIVVDCRCGDFDPLLFGPDLSDRCDQLRKEIESFYGFEVDLSLRWIETPETSPLPTLFDPCKRDQWVVANGLDVVWIEQEFVIVRATLEQHLTGIAHHPNRVFAISVAYDRGTCVRSIDQHRVGNATQVDDQPLLASVGNASTHTEAGQRGGIQDSGIADRVATIVDVEGITIGVTIDGQDCIDEVHRTACCRSFAPNIHRIIPITGMDGSRRRDRLHVDGVAALLRIDEGRSGNRQQIHGILARVRIQCSGPGMGARNG